MADPSVGLCHAAAGRGVAGRGVHSSTFWLNVSGFCGIEGVIRGCLGGVHEVLGGIRGCVWCILCQKRLRSS